MHKRKKYSIDSEIIDYIERYLDKDVNLILENKPLDLGKKTLPEFDEFEVYDHIYARMKKRKRHSLAFLLKWTAVVLLMVGNVGYFTYNFAGRSKKPLSREVAVLKGDKIIVMLTDGSRVWLNSDTKLTYPEQFVGNERRVALEGEAYFEVKSDPEHPFYVSAGDLQVQVTGTSFNISAYPSDEEVITTLDEGQISIGRFMENAALHVMRPGQTAVYNRVHGSCKISMNEYYKEASGWRENRLTFRNATLESVLKVLSRQFDVSFEIENDKIRGYTYNLSTKGGDLSNVLKMMESITPVRIIKKSEYAYVIK